MNIKKLKNIMNDYHKNTNDNVIGVGYGFKITKGKRTAEKSVVFMVKEKKLEKNLLDDDILPSKILVDDEYINTDIVQDNIKALWDNDFYSWIPDPCDGTAPIVCDGVSSSSKVTPVNRDIIRPLKGGVSMTNWTSLSGYVGTLGFLAIDNETNSLIGVSNNHVLIDDGFLSSDRDYNGDITNISGDVVVQPHPYDGDTSVNQIGIVKKYYPLNLTGDNPIDIAITTISQSVIDSLSSYNQQGLLLTGYSFASTLEIDNLLTSDPDLYSAGRTTGAKGEGNMKLKISSINTPVTVSGYNLQGVEKSIIFSDCIGFIATSGTSGDLSPYPIYSGDSGSALIAEINGIKKIIGVCFAGGDYSAFACRIDSVASLMNISAWNGETVNYSDINNIEEYVINGLSDQKYITVSGKTYWQAGIYSK